MNDGIVKLEEQQQEIDRLNDVAWALLLSDAQKSEELARQAQQLVSECPVSYPAGLAQSLLILSILHWDRSNYADALPMALEAVRLFEQVGNCRQQAYTLKHIAGIHFLLGNYVEALEIGYQAMRVGQESGDRSLYASLLNDVAYISLHVGHTKDALPQLFESLKLHRETRTQPGEAQVLDSIGKAYLLMGDYAKALSYELESLELDRQIGYKRAEVEALANIGKIHAATGQTELAVVSFSQALILAQAQGYRQFEASILLDMGRFHLTQGQPERALDSLQRALSVAQEIQSKPVLVDIHAAMATVYEQQGRHADALAHLKQSYQLKEEVFNEHANHRLHSLQVTYQVQKAQQEAEIYQLKNVELQQQIETHEKLIAELNAYAHSVAHDLKNPLAVIVGFAELLKDECGSILPESNLLYVEEVLYNSYKASSIIDNLLLLASVRQQDVTPQVLNMTAIVAEAERRIASQIMSRGAQLTKPDTWPVALGHAPWVEAIWVNYIINALKYGGNPPQVELGATVGAGIVRFWVRDNGPGVSKEDQARLFTEFTRLNMVGNGHGLGLSIVKRIVEKLGGTVGVESNGVPGQGSIFSFTLPAATESESERGTV